MAQQPVRWDLETDVVCVGSGLGSLTAAIVAHDKGARVVVLDKAPKLGGVCAYSGGEVFVPANHKMEEAGCPDSRAHGLAYLQFLDGGYADRELQAILLDRGREAARYLGEKAGVRWKIIKGFPDYHYPHAPGTAREGRYLEVELFNGSELGEWQAQTYATSPHMPPGISHDELFAWGSLSCVLTWDFKTMGKRLSKDVRGFGPGMMANFVKAAQIDRKIPAHIKTPIRELVSENGAVVGVRAERGGKDFWVRARKGVILAIGGYDWKPEFARYYEGLPEWHSMCQPNVEGDNLILGGEIGAAYAGVPNYNLGMFFGFRIPGEEHEGKPLWRASWEGGYPHALWVNKAGQRFGDESFYRDYLPKARAWNGSLQQHPNYPPYLVFDQNYREKYGFATYLPGQDIPEELVARADSPRALAEKLGIDAAAFEKTLARFNQYADDGVDPDFGRGTYPWAAMMTGDKTRKNPNLGPLNKAPYYGLALRPVGVGVNAVGLRTNASAQALHVRGHAIPGLYAVGNSAAALDTGAGYQSGLSNLRGMTWGYVAGLHASGR
jgi:3-oxosteroid 1-dehydrogenase